LVECRVPSKLTVQTLRNTLPSHLSRMDTNTQTFYDKDATT